MSRKKKGRHIKKSYFKKALLNVLNNIGEAAFQFIDEGLLNPNYTFTGLSRELLGLNHGEGLKNYRKREVELRRNMLAVTLWRLQQEGLVARKGPRKHALWKITVIGKRYLKKINAPLIMRELPPEDGKIRIVSFDIPEKERWKRDRLRVLLNACDYSLLQRSLWIGRRPLAPFVFAEIKNLKLRHFVHIFEISQRGTIRGLV